MKFTRMDDATEHGFVLLRQAAAEHNRGLADRILAIVRDLKNSVTAYQIDRTQHLLQAATRALRDGADEETVVCVLLHDIGTFLSTENHAALAAEILRPYVSRENCWMIEKHGLFQSYHHWHGEGSDRNARDRYRGHSCFERTVRFCERWDQVSFDPDYDTLPLETFEPMVRRIFSRKPFAHREPP